MNVPITYGKYYHIYNRGNNGDNIFINDEDYLHFLDLYSVYIDSIAYTFAWCLMKNHFHILVRIKNEDEIGYLDNRTSKSNNLHLKWKTTIRDLGDSNFINKPLPFRQFQHFFNAYAKYFNKRNERTGSLFENSFDRKFVNHKKYFQNIVTYIHQNPVKHGFAEHILEYPWTSYLTVLSFEPTNIKRDEVLFSFGGIDNYIKLHNKNQNNSSIEHLIME
ncbi:MAG: hypothetical protein M0Q90_09120 [Bacteroidales bacterium]|nr:hypothetical protein [Bacteroidales bacterium]